MKLDALVAAAAAARERAFAPFSHFQVGAALEDKLARAASKSLVNYAFYIGATPHNVSELKQARRTPGIKIFIGSSTGDLLVDSQEALERIFAETTLPICAHCEDETTVRANTQRLDGGKHVSDHSKIRDHQAAVIATKRAFDLSTRHKHRFHLLHCSTAEEAELLRHRPSWITAEACPHHLLFNVDDYERLGTLVQMNPSIKTAVDNQALWEALRDGRIDIIATDHSPHTREEKAKPYPQSPSGLPAIENSLALMLDASHRGLCTLEQIVNWMSFQPARVWDVKNKGRIAEGYDADLVLVDLQRKQTVRNADQVAKVGWSPWDGVELTGWPVRTIVGGETAYLAEGNQFFPVRGREVEFER